MKRMMIVLAGLGVAACDGAPAPASEENAPKQKAELLEPGLYEVSVTVDKLASADGAEPATPLEAGQELTKQVCVASEGISTPALYAEGDDDCALRNPYVRPGRFQSDLRCTRSGVSGQVNLSANGTYEAESFETDVRTLTALASTGDYAMSRTVTGRRVGDCPTEGDESAG
ncbi:DUF3617 domain-containing protein [Sphingomicrobium lutaoense]|uniref:DUF3617 domain-containing protein n=1 Tax=Sphingomicrobium lutaoense TaxID=515949 RepID=A0A839Z6Y0_9SPHN|nr:DUF3617 family protein [Sphingomicrobium lutaoense]MBB3764514.1 hypothetical protein [Sphingomicrobium lutaoense]